MFKARVLILEEGKGVCHQHKRLYQAMEGAQKEGEHPPFGHNHVCMSKFYVCSSVTKDCPTRLYLVMYVDEGRDY